jgi:oxygen-independent coproporphyrinogen-3 oxidase
MAGLYVHIPFCSEKCFYCDFFSGNQLYLIDSYVDALVKEIGLRANYIQGEHIDTIYFGGGTPSLLTKSQLSKILNEIYLIFDVHAAPEITIECNPENINNQYVKDLFEVGFNRISLGVQFLDDEILSKFNRKHNKQLIFNSLTQINSSKFTNLSIDLIFSVPGISGETLLSSLIQLLDYDIKHISAYSLTISKNSQLFWKIERGEVIENDEDTFLDQYKIINDFVKSKGYIQYEISNYAKEGYFSKHNLSYWNQIPYIGIGVSAHSYNLVSRQWNQKNIKKYIRELNEGKNNFEIEQLSDIQIYNEYIFLKLRTFQGLSYNFVRSNFRKEIFDHFVSKINFIKSNQHFIFDSDLIIPKESDLLIADYLAKLLIF